MAAGKSGLACVDVTDCTDIYVGFGSIKHLLGHFGTSSLIINIIFF
jgi:hypothetical protein